MHGFLQRAWYEGDKRWWLFLPLLWPVSLLIALIARCRRLYLQPIARKQNAMLVASGRIPTVVIGNISMGGTGKTPLIAALTCALQASGWRPGIVSRGYGGEADIYPLSVNPDTPAHQCGDEPRLLARRTGAPLVVDPNRTRAITYLLAQTDCNIVLSDDGLQHYRMHRDLEIAVLDGARGLGNGLLFPAGPLRESAQRLTEVDFCVVNRSGALHPSLLSSAHASAQMTLVPTALVNVKTGELRQDFEPFKKTAWQAVCGIGNPNRFYATLQQLQFQYQPHSFPDHHSFEPQDFNDWLQLPVLMTEKDAVKCQHFAGDNWWFLRVEPQFSEGFMAKLLARLEVLSHNT